MFTVEGYGMGHIVYCGRIWNEMYCLLWKGAAGTVGDSRCSLPSPFGEGLGVRLYTVYSSSWNSGSSGTTITGFCCAAFRMSAGTYLLSTTRRKVYSLNQRLVMIRQPC